MIEIDELNRSYSCEWVNLSSRQKFSIGRNLIEIQRVSSLFHFLERYVEFLKLIGLHSLLKGGLKLFFQVSRKTQFDIHGRQTDNARNQCGKGFGIPGNIFGGCLHDL